MTVNELAGAFGVHRTTASNHLQNHGIQPDRRGLNPNDRSEAARLYQQGWTSGMLANRFNVSSSTILRALRNDRVHIRPPGRRT